MPAPAWNEVSRFALVRALVDGRVHIDPDHPSTEDKSFYAGRYYSDKAPGASLLAVPAYLGYLAWSRVRGGPGPEWRTESSLRGAIAQPGRDRIFFNAPFRRAVHVCSLLTSGLAGAACGVLLFFVLVAGGVLAGRALVASLALSLGSLHFAYASMFYGHVLAGGFLFGA